MHTNQPSQEDSTSQEIQLEDDPELAAIDAQLQETSTYAINPTFKEELREELLQQFAENK